jgi:Tol biopolymer transport system component
VQFVFIRNGDAWIANADGTGGRNVTNFASGGADAASWSPDGRFLAVTQETQLWILSFDRGYLRPIDLGPGRTAFYGAPVWSADSARLAVVVQQGDSPSTLIVHAGDWTATAMTGAGIDEAAWSPDGRFIALLDRSAHPGQIDIANSDGSGRRTIWTASDGASRVTWFP